MQTLSHVEGGPKPASSQKPTVINSILVADCGTVFTKVSLFGLVEGQFRLMARGEAPTTAAPPQGDITKGIVQAIENIEFVTGRRFISQGHIITPEEADGDGVDIFITTISAGGPIRLMVLGAVSPALEELADQAVSGLYAETHPLAAPSYAAHSQPSASSGNTAAPQAANASPWTPERTALEWERQLERIREIQPQAALIVGLADGPAGPHPLQEACQLLLNMTKERAEKGVPQAGKRISVVYAGAPQYVEAVRHMLGNAAEVIRVEPLISQAQLGSTSTAINNLYNAEVIQRIPGYNTLQSWFSSTPVATATSLSSLVRFLAQHYAMNVTAVDVGGATTTVMFAGEQGEFMPVVHSGVGVGPNVGEILQQVGFQRIARWLPFDITEEELREYVLNCMLHPHVTPAQMRELQIAQAFAREAISVALEEGRRHKFAWPDTDLILATGGIFAHTARNGQAALILLDSLQPKGVTSLVLDRTMLVSQLGAVATVAPVAAVQVNENDAVTHRLGTCVIPFGNLPSGQVALRVGIEYHNGRQLSVDVMSGSIEVIPLRLNEQALLTLYPAPTVDVGLGPGERARAAEEIDGGLIGLIIDARGRPLVLPEERRERQARLLQWMQVLGG
ncbi:MAG TPA: glutamate mutase L [Ktedonobacteraceae bacterium]|nr:glutamate mutase L [Ktedonobacteraceae bacterium]